VATDAPSDATTSLPGAPGDLTPPWQRGGLREVLVLAWPVVMQMSAETMLQVINSAMVGRLGATELGAVGFGGIWTWTLIAAFFGTGTGVQVFAARADGAGRPHECGPWVWQAFYALIPASIIWTALIGLGFPTLLAVIDPSPELRIQAGLYVQARLPGIPITIAGGVLNSFFRGLGDTRTPMYATLVAVCVNVFCAYGLIFGEFGLPAWGVYGAGMAIVISQTVYTSILLVRLLSRGQRATYATRPVRVDLLAIKRFLRTSGAIGGQWLLDSTSFALFTSIVARMGDNEMAASQAMLQLLSLSYMQAIAISVATGTLVGRYIGSDDLAAASRSYGSAMKLAMLLAVTVATLFLTIPELLMQIFTRDPGVIELGGPLLLLGAFFQFVDAVLIITNGSLRGGGDTRWPFMVSATLAWVLRLPLVYLFGIVLEGGVFGAWIGELGFILVLATALVLRFRAGHWRSMRI